MKREIVTSLSELDRYLKKVNYIFPIKNLLDTKIDVNIIKDYYKDSYAGYKYLHSKEGAVHMSINYDGIFDESGFFTQANEINKIIDKNNPRNVLELGSGKGFNSIFLAKQNPTVSFIGIDITDEHLLIASRHSENLKNLSFTYGDFHNLDFNDATFDLIFELESICHAKNTDEVLSEIFRILKPGGIFVVYEGFKSENFDNLPENLKIAAALVEKSMAVNSFDKIDNWLKSTNKVGFTVLLKKDISEAIMPNLGKFQLLARKYFKFPFLSNLFLKILPRNMVMNSVAGLLMPFTVLNDAHRYINIILKR